MALDSPLDPIEARILGVLIEKELTTPDQYPLTLHALTSGCNQRSNRDPVLELSESAVAEGIERLRRRSLLGASQASGARVGRWLHSAGTVLGVEKPELAVLSELMLRGAQSPGELRGRASRMHPFRTLPELDVTLDALATKGLVARVAPRPGLRVPKWEALIVERSAVPAAPVEALPQVAQVAQGAREPQSGMSLIRPSASLASPSAPADFEARIAALEAEVARLARLCDELTAERSKATLE